MKKSLLFLILFVLTSSIFSQTLFVEDFNYNVGDLLTSKGWVVSSGTTNPLTVVAPGLTFSGYPASGNACELKTTGEDDYKSFTAVSSGSVYLSFLIKVISAQATGDYFIALSPSSTQTNYYMRTHIKSSGNGFLIGLSKSNELTGGYIYGKTVLNFNKTYAVVVKHTFLGTPADSTNDPEQVYVFDTSFPTSEPTTAEIANYVQSTKSDPKDLGYITLRQGTSTAAPDLIIDGLRVAKTWSTITDIKNVTENIPTQFELSQNYPNPFNPETSIKFSIPKESNVSLKIYDVLGNEVATLVNEVKQAGVYNVNFNAKNLTSGLYIYKLQAVNPDKSGQVFIQTKKMMLIK